MRGPAAFLTPFEAERLADVAGEVGLHLAKLVLAADQLAGVQLAAGVEGDHQHLHVRGGLVAVHHGRQDVLGTVAVLEPVEGAAEVVVLLVPAHGMDLLGRSADEVLKGMDGVLADLLGGAGVPGFHDALGGAGTLEHQVLAHAGLIGVRGVAFTVVVAQGCAQMPLGLDLAHAEDGEAPGRARSAAHVHALAEVRHHIRHVAPPFEKNVHSLDNLSYVQIIPFAPAGGSAHFSQMDQRCAQGKRSRLRRLDPRPLPALRGRCGSTLPWCRLLIAIGRKHSAFPELLLYTPKTATYIDPIIC